MPSIRGLTGSTNQLLDLRSGSGVLVRVTRREVSDWLKANPTATAEQVAAQIKALLEARWNGRTDTVHVAVHDLTTLRISILIASAGVTVPANWWQ